MCKEAGGGGREAEEKEPGIQNQKQEPHTKMWGKTYARRAGSRLGRLPCHRKLKLSK